jgi:hypothetical protein
LRSFAATLVETHGLDIMNHGLSTTTPSPPLEERVWGEEVLVY